ncbi:MAG: hypothetical protein JST86_14775 [Bacteroidetes bacterium]|nr:hypothetical protein [Bacteroidota bacterium]
MKNILPLLSYGTYNAGKEVSVQEETLHKQAMNSAGDVSTNTSPAFLFG